MFSVDKDNGEHITFKNLRLTSFRFLIFFCQKREIILINQTQMHE